MLLHIALLFFSVRCFSGTDVQGLTHSCRRHL